MRHVHMALKQWFLTGPGLVVLKQEKNLINNAIRNLFGYVAVQVGAPSSEDLMKESRINNKVLVSQEVGLSPYILDSHTRLVRADLSFLPIKANVADLVVLPHSLERVADPYHLLRQVDSMLVPEGHIVITGFNVKGCLIMRQSLGYFSQQKGLDRNEVDFKSIARVTEWLEVLGYELKSQAFSDVTCFRQPKERSRLFSVLERLERLLAKLGFKFGNVYCLVAQKKVDAPTLVGAKWQISSWSGAVKGQSAPTVRNQNRE